MRWNATFGTTRGGVYVILGRVSQQLAGRKAGAKRGYQTVFRLAAMAHGNAIHLTRRAADIVENNGHDNPRQVKPQVNQNHGRYKGRARWWQRIQIVRIGKGALWIDINHGRAERQANGPIE